MSSQQGSPGGELDPDAPVSHKLSILKHRKKQAANDAQLLMNRIALLQKEEERARKKIDATKDRANEILSMRHEHEKRIQVNMNLKDANIKMNTHTLHTHTRTHTYSPAFSFSLSPSPSPPSLSLYISYIKTRVSCLYCCSILLQYVCMCVCMYVCVL